MADTRINRAFEKVIVLTIFIFAIPNAQEIPDSSDTDSTAAESATIDTQAVVQPEPAPVLADTTKKTQPPNLPEKSTALRNSFGVGVDIGYGTCRPRLLTTSIVAQDSTFSAGAFNSLQMMQRSFGVAVTQNLAQPYFGPVVQVSGIGSIYAGTPVYIVDGIPMRDISLLNADEIASTSFLNDGPSAAILGFRGANGAILITTKSGEGTPSVTYDGFVGIQNPWRKPKMCTAEQWATLNDRAHANDSLPPDTVNYPGIQNPASLGAGTNWFDQVINKNALITGNSISFSAGTKDIHTYVSSNYSYAQGLVRESDFQRLGFRVNVKGNVRKWLSMGNNFDAGGIRFNPASEPGEWNGVMESALAIEPVIPAHDANGNLVSSVNQQLNPVGIIDRTHDSNAVNTFDDNLFTDISIFNFVKYHACLGVLYSDFENKTFTPLYAYEPFQPGGFSERNVTSVVQRTSDHSLGLVFEHHLSLEKTFGDLNTVSLLAGQEGESDSASHFLGRNTDVPSNDPSQWYLSSATSTSPYVEEYPSFNSSRSYFGRAGYDFASKYMASCSYRWDKPYQIVDNNSWSTSPSLSAAWRASEESFLKPVSFLSELKFFGGWSRISSQGFADSSSFLFSPASTQTSSQDYNFSSQIVAGTTSLNAGSQSSFSQDRSCTSAGIDFSLFKNELGCSVRYFNQNTDYLILNMSDMIANGMSTYSGPDGITYKDQGYEIHASMREQAGDFSAAASLNVLIDGNRVLSTEGPPIMNASILSLGPVTRTETGHSIGEFYGYKTDGLFQNQAEIDADTYTDATGTHLVQPDARPGDIRYQHNADGSLTRGYIGNPHPDFTYGFNLDLGYKAFDIDVYVQGSVGNKIFNAARLKTESNGAFFNVDQHMLGSWNGPGSTNDPSLSRMTINNSDDDMLISDRYVEDGSYARVKSVQIGYTVPRDVSMKLKVRKCRIYAGCENILTFTKYRGLDPELMPNRLGLLGAGVDYGSTYPQPLTFIFGLNLAL